MTVAKLLDRMQMLCLKRFKGAVSPAASSSSSSSAPSSAGASSSAVDDDDADADEDGEEDEEDDGEDGNSDCSSEGEDLDYEYEDDDALGGLGASVENSGVNAVWLQEHKMKRRWAEKEAELRAQMAGAAAAAKQAASGVGGGRPGSQAAYPKVSSSSSSSSSSGSGASYGSSSSSSSSLSDVPLGGMSQAALALTDRSQGGLNHNEVTNIFSGAASSKVLTADLYPNILRSQEELGLKAEAIDDNIYHWRVKLDVDGFFALDSERGNLLARDLEVQEKFGYEYVELEIHFTIDLYPFFPPQVKIVRPRFEGFILGQIAQIDSHSCRTGTAWAP